MHVAEICHRWLQIETIRVKVGAEFGVSWFPGVAQNTTKRKTILRMDLGPIRPHDGFSIQIHPQNVFRIARGNVLYFL